MKKLMLALVAVGCIALVGCDEKKDGAKHDGSAKAASTGSAAAGGGAAGGKLGVQECDDYITKMEACMGKMPAEAKPAQEAAFKQMREAWEKSIKEGGDAAKEGLKTGCKAALDGLAQNPMCK